MVMLSILLKILTEKIHAIAINPEVFRFDKQSQDKKFPDGFVWIWQLVVA